MAQQFRSPIDGKIITVEFQYVCDSQKVVLWSHIQQSLGDVRFLQVGGMNIYCMVDDRLEILKPLRIKYRPGVVIDVILNEEPPLRTQDVKEVKKGDEVSLVRSPPAYSSEPNDDYIRFGSFVCLRHMSTGGFLRSSNLRYKVSLGQSGQYIVYGVRSRNPGQDDWWVVVPTVDDNKESNEQIQYGTRVRLLNKANNRWLHSHRGIKSPATRSQQEVTGWGDSVNTDLNDVWVIEKAEDGNDYWKSNDIFILRHELTDQYLHSHSVEFLGEKEVTGFDMRDNVNNLWRVRRG
ncbi:hypothetical protein BGZ80_003997 [Entomortierella chlamydospora]|uniref:MIR domain-containing protein n=1 Tax=Entomortierella chlamydospora TaxID=101097 RepID=A0A9P6MML1_9FUNG|nr:hypothetical protein BGZ79_004091 [Entomortierella chlamydospora]KAG0007977.1 hypothetical protein BGZ80_003997 [Entomortierella chlamydospora]